MNNILNFAKLKNAQNPWGQKPGNDPKGEAKPRDVEDEWDEMMKKGRKFLQKVLKDGSGGGKKGSSGPGKTQKSLFGMFLLGVLALWLASGFYKVNSDENAVVLYFGKFHTIATPGLNYRIPAPFGKIIKKSVTTVNTEEFGFRTAGSSSRSYFGRNSGSVSTNYEDESLMLTGDENIVDIDFQVQWQIGDIKNYIFNIENQNIAIRKAAESAMREVIAKTPIASALSDGKKSIEMETKSLLQEILDSYGSGISIVLVQLRRVDPPKQVIDAFRDVQTAKADKERIINQAQAYKNDIIPRARGEAVKFIQESEAYKQEVIANAEGQASRFLAVLRQYSRAKRVTKKRMYLETMEKLYQDMDKIIIDKNVSKSGVVPYLPLNELKKK